MAAKSIFHFAVSGFDEFEVSVVVNFLFFMAQL